MITTKESVAFLIYLTNMNIFLMHNQIYNNKNNFLFISYSLCNEYRITTQATFFAYGF